MEELSYQALGHCNSSLEIFTRWSLSAETAAENSKCLHYPAAPPPMACFGIFFKGSCSETEVSEQLYYQKKVNAVALIG